MLIQKGYQEGDVLVFKLVTGEEVVAKFVEENSNGFVVSKPMSVVPSQQGIGLMQAMISADINNNVTLNSATVIMHSPVIDSIKAHYIRTTTGIETAPTSGIIS